MKIVKISAVILATSLATGCASMADIENLQAQINGLNATLSTTAAKASAAEAAANRAAQYAQDTNRKLGRMFKKSMMK